MLAMADNCVVWPTALNETVPEMLRLRTVTATGEAAVGPGGEPLLQLSVATVTAAAYPTRIAVECRTAINRLPSWWQCPRGLGLMAGAA